MAERLPRAQPRLSRVADALTRDVPAPVKQGDQKPTDNVAWDDKFANFLERVMAVAAAGEDPKPLQEEYNRLIREAPPGKREELENNRGKPPATR